MAPESSGLKDNLIRVRERIEEAAIRAGREPEEISLVAVSKTHSARKIELLYEAGVRHFGENRVQERESKLVGVSGLDITWHMIGHLQRNKAARAVELFHSVDSLDGIVLAEKIDRAKGDFNAGSGDNAGKLGVRNTPDFVAANRLRVLIEVKLDPQPTKTGASEEELPRLAEGIGRLPNLDLRGLMGVPPYFEDPEEARLYFRRLRELRDQLRAHLGPGTLPVLSMGMSDDLEVAIEEGATEVRVGTALFGAREKA